MKLGKVVALATICLIFLGCVPLSDVRPYVRNQENVKHLENSVVALVVSPDTDLDVEQTEDNLGQEHDIFCSGFYIGPQTIVTARHCTVERHAAFRITEDRIEMSVTETNLSTVKVSTYNMFQRDEHFKQYLVFDVVARDEDADVAILVLRPGQSTTSQHDFMCLSTDQIVPGQPVAALGHPAGEPWILSEGIISRPSFHWNNDGAKMIGANAPIYFGNSGGPLIDQHGCAMGVAKAIAARQSTLGIWSDISNVRHLLETIHLTQL